MTIEELIEFGAVLSRLSPETLDKLIAVLENQLTEMLSAGKQP